MPRDRLRAGLGGVVARGKAEAGDKTMFDALAQACDAYDAAVADELFSVLMGEDVEARRSFIQRNAKDVRFLDI